MRDRNTQLDLAELAAANDPADIEHADIEHAAIEHAAIERADIERADVERVEIERVEIERVEIERVEIERVGVLIHPTATVEDDVEIGRGTRIWHQAHIRCGARIGRECTIGKDVYIDAGVIVGNRVKIQNGVSVYRGVTLEDDAFVGPHASFTNDEMPRAFAEDWQVTPTLVRRGASIGANATIVCGVTLGPFSMVAAGSTVTSDVMPHGLVIGSPARLVAYVCRRGHRMRSTTSLDYRTVYECAECRERLTIDYGIDVVLGDRRNGIDRRRPHD